MKMRRSFALATMESITKAVEQGGKAKGQMMLETGQTGLNFEDIAHILWEDMIGCSVIVIVVGALTIGWLLVVVVHFYRRLSVFSYENVLN